MRPRKLAPIVAVAFAAAVLVACGSSDDPTLTPPDSPTEQSAPTGTSETANGQSGATSDLWRGTAATVAGEDLDLGTYAGRDVAVWFWAPW